MIVCENMWKGEIQCKQWELSLVGSNSSPHMPLPIWYRPFIPSLNLHTQALTISSFDFSVFISSSNPMPIIMHFPSYIMHIVYPPSFMNSAEVWTILQQSFSPQCRIIGVHLVVFIGVNNVQCYTFQCFELTFLSLAFSLCHIE